MKDALSLFFRLVVIAALCYAILLLPNPWVGFGVLAAVLFILFPLRLYLARRRFMRRLKRLCRARGVDLEIHQGWQTQLILRTEVGTFACVVVPSLFRSVPIIFDDDGIRYRHIWGLRVPAMGGVRSVTRAGRLRGGVHTSESRAVITKAYGVYVAPGIKLRLPSGYIKRFVIVNPKPHHVLAGHVQSHIHVDNGERIGGHYTVYTGGAFCDFLDRQTATYTLR